MSVCQAGRQAHACKGCIKLGAHAGMPHFEGIASITEFISMGKAKSLHWSFAQGVLDAILGA